MSSDVMQELKDLRASIDERDSELSKKAEEYLAQSKKNGEVGQELKTQVDQMMTEQNTDRKKLNDLEVKLGEAEKMFVDLDTHGAGNKRMSIGELVTNTEGFEAFKRDNELQQKGELRVTVPHAELLTSDFDEGVFTRDNQGFLPLIEQRLFVRDLIAPGRTNDRIIEYVRETGFDNQADTVEEGKEKPESSLSFEPADTRVKVIAHWMKASNQILADIPALMSMINHRLKFGLKVREEEQILFGDGTGENLEGITTVASKYDKEFTADKHTAIDDIRLSMLQAQLAELPSTGTVMHYTDWARVETLKDENGRYIFGDPSTLKTPSLWGLPIVATTGSGFKEKFLTGAFALGAQIFDREDANVVISTEDGDNIRRNMVTIRAEERLALATYRPEAFIFGDFTLGD